jgi:hypothetical protein
VSFSQVACSETIAAFSSALSAIILSPICE